MARLAAAHRPRVTRSVTWRAYSVALIGDVARPKASGKPITDRLAAGQLNGLDVFLIRRSGVRIPLGVLADFAFRRIVLTHIPPDPQVAGMNFGRIIVWLILGALAGALAGRVATFSRTGFGRWINLAFGMLGAVVGGFLFSLFNIKLGLGEIMISLEDVVSAFLGSLLCIFAWWLIRRRLQKNKPEPPA
jgi:uncharacterized membrane protein YeaQ/YmgE (transglycosylase-associated protein family)